MEAMPLDDAGSLVFMREIRRDNAVTDRCVRKWIAAGKFPQPDGNRCGRNFWLRKTYRRWQEHVLAGGLKQLSHLAKSRVASPPRSVQGARETLP